VTINNQTVWPSDTTNGCGLITKVNDISIQPRGFIYPNPATDKITVKISEAVKETNLEIFDLEGQKLITVQITEPKSTIDISNLPNGVYIVRLADDKTVEVGKIVKQ
jgi:hypothetical protein